MCDEWLHSFETFLSDVGKRIDPTYSIERKNVNEGYSPENCCWASKTEQSRNTRLRKDNTSGIRGVQHNKQSGNWIATIFVDKNIIRLGVFTSKEEATKVRRAAELKYWGKIYVN